VAKVGVGTNQLRNTYPKVQKGRKPNVGISAGREVENANQILIAGLRACGKLDADLGRNIHQVFNCSPREAARFVQFPLTALDEGSKPIGRSLCVNLI
jgi:hypothetical protein